MFRGLLVCFFYCSFSLASPTKKILFIEDTEYVRILIEEFLIEKGFAVHSAKSIEEALLAWYVFKPDLVLLDMGLPLYPYSSNTYREGGLTILRLAPMDNAKVILSSNIEIKAFSSILPHLIDYNFNGKFMPPNHLTVLEELINTTQPPKRIATLNQLEKNLGDTIEAELRNSINTLLLLKQEQIGALKPPKQQEIRNQISQITKEVQKKLLKLQKIQE